MNKLTLLLASTVAVAFGASAFAAETTSYESKTKIEQKADGSMEKKTSETKVDAVGKTKVEVKTDVDVKHDGDMKKTVTTKTVDDPKGMFNKETTKTKDVVETKDGKTETTHKKTVDGKTVEESHTEGH